MLLSWTIPHDADRWQLASDRATSKATTSPARWRVVAACMGAMGVLAQSPTVSAHVVLAQKAAAAGSYYRAQFMVGHGCEGSPTISVQVDIPDGVPVARPQPKAGWTLSYETGPLAEPAMVHGKQKTLGIRQVTWTGGPLPDEQYEEFGMLLFLSKPGRLHFRVLQTCEQGANDWSGVAAEGKPKPAFPAATLDVLAPHSHGGGAHHQGHVHPQQSATPAAMPPPAGADSTQQHAH